MTSAASGGAHDYSAFDAVRRGRRLTRGRRHPGAGFQRRNAVALNAAEPPASRISEIAQSATANSADILRVVDDWPEVVPIFGDELDAIETYLAPLLDELLSAKPGSTKD
jgi:hypothetical protein